MRAFPPLPACRTLVRCFIFVSAAFLSIALTLAGKPIASQGSPGSAADAAALNIATAGDELDEPPVGEPQFDTTLHPLPPNVPGVGFEATGTSEFGDLVRLADRAHYVDSVTVTLSSWAIRSDFPGSAALGFTHPLTLRIYRVDRSSGTARPGDPIATVTHSFLIPWRPEPDASSSSPLRPWHAADGNYYTGRAFTVTFDLSALSLSLPDEIIYGISFNTQHYGPGPLGVPGPYNALHVGLSVEAPSAGADLEPDAVFWKTANGRDYADGGGGGANTLRRDPAWTPYKPAVRFNNSPYGVLASTAARLGALPAADAKTAAILERGHTLTSWALERRLWDGTNHLQPGAGRLVFDLLAEAADQLRGAAQGTDATAVQARAAIESLQTVAGSLAEMAVGDALIGGGRPDGFVRAQDAIDAAQQSGAQGQAAKAIDELGNAWREADLSLH
jgi:hypothetical protein